MDHIPIILPNIWLTDGSVPVAAVSFLASYELNTGESITNFYCNNYRNYYCRYT